MTGEQLRLFRLEVGISGRELARRVDSSHTALRRLEAGKLIDADLIERAEFELWREQKRRRPGSPVHEPIAQQVEVEDHQDVQVDDVDQHHESQEVDQGDDGFTPPPGYTWVQEWGLWMPPGQAPKQLTWTEVKAQHQADTFLGEPVGLVRDYAVRPRRHPLNHPIGDAWHQVQPEGWMGGENAARLRGRR